MPESTPPVSGLFPGDQTVSRAGLAGGESADVVCPLCATTSHHKDFDFSTSRVPGSVPGLVVTCCNCRLRFKIPVHPEIPLADYYADAMVYRERDDVTEANKEFARILRIATELSAPGSRLLDIGSGPGHFLCAAARAGFSVTGIELNPELARLAAQTSGTEVIVGDCTAINTILRGREQSFDLVTMLDVIEHVSDPVDLLRNAAAFVTPGGTLLIYTPNHHGLIARVAEGIGKLSAGRVDGPVRGIYDCDHVVFFDPASLRDAVRRAGLRDGSMMMIQFNPARRGVARGVTAHLLRLLELASPWIGGEFRMLLVAHVD